MKTRKKLLSFLLVLTLIMTLLPAQLFATQVIDTPIHLQTDLLDSERTTPTIIDINPNIFVGDGYEVEFKVSSQWPSAFNGEIILTNTGEKALENWTLAFDFEHKINNMWNAQIIKHEGTSYLVKNLEWNQDIAPGSSASIGFGANWNEYINPPQNYDLLIAEQEVGETDYTIDFKVVSDWGQAFNGEISITNNTEEAIEDWTLEFDFDRNIDRFWTAEIVKHEGNHYIIKNLGYNANIAPGKTLQLGFSGNPGNVDSEPSGYKLNQIGQEIDYTKDTDGDGLPDFFEKILGTNLNKADTDGDGLPDGYEYIILGTDPLKSDTDDNGIIDGDEDFDEDGLINSKEYLLGTDPYNEDTDHDGLSDIEEIDVYGTDPILYDTDEDGIGDGDEIKLGLNPLSKYTHDGVLDSDYIIEQTISESILEKINEDNRYDFTLSVKAAGLADSSLIVEESSYSSMLEDNDAILGKVISLSYENLKFESAVLNFKIDTATINNSNLNFPLVEGLKGIQRYQIFCYNENYGVLYPVETSYDTVNNILTTETNSLGEYCIIDMDQWLYGLGINFDDPIETYAFENSRSFSVERESLNNINMIESDNQVKDDILPENYHEIILKQINEVSAVQDEIAQPLRLFSSMQPTSTPTYNKQIDLVFVIDTSGSMSSKINQCKSSMSTLVQNLYNEGITARVAVISFDDYRYANITYKLSSGEIWGKNPTDASNLISQVKITNGAYENHVDALETALNLSFRGNTSKFAVLLTDEPLTTNDNNSKIGASGIAEELSKKGIITSVVCSNSDISSFRPIFEKTDGIQISISTSFNIYLEIFIKTVMRDNNVFSTVIPNSLTTISLKGSPRLNSTINSDKDGLTDSEEIDWTLIKEVNNNLLLPTLQEYLHSLKLDNIETFLRLSKEKANIINSMVVLPIKSNPAKEDSDGDGYWDDKDPRPLISDVIITKLKDAKEFVKINDNGKYYYGGNQDWFSSTTGQYGGCGTVAGANITAYMAKYNSKHKGLYNFNTNNYTKSGFTAHMETVYDYVTPIKLPLISKYEPPLKIGDTTFGWTVGIWPLSSFVNGFEKFAKSRNVDIKACYSSADFNKTNVMKYIKEGLSNNSPVAMLIGFNSKLNSIETTSPDGTWSQSFGRHWVTITEIKEDKITNETVLKVSTWGGYAYINLDDYIMGEKVYEALIYFK